jgi:nucleotide-binding universal stress UspA family protein
LYKKILVPIDGSESSLKALRHALALARTHSSNITVLSVIEELKLPFGAEYMLWANESHNELIRSTLESLNRETKKIMEQEPDLDVDAEIREGVPAKVIVQTALDENYDLIVIGKRGMGVLEELVMGNIARKVVDLSKVPVTIIP